MTTTIQHKRSSTTGHVPSSLLTGELAINEADSLLYYLDNSVVTKKRLIEPRAMIASGTVTNVANLTLDLTAANVGVMRGFDIYLSELNCATNAVRLQMRLGDASGIKTGATAYWFSWYALDHTFASGSSDENYDTSSSSIGLMEEASMSSSAGRGAFAIVHVGTNDSAYASAPSKIAANIMYQNSSGNYVLNVTGGRLISAITLTQCQFYFSSGNIATCRYALIGVP